MMGIMGISRQTVLAGTGLFLLGAAFGWLGAVLGHSYQGRDVIAIREQDARYPYISRLLLCESNDEKASPAYESMKRAFQDVLAANKAQRRISFGAVYFRDLSTGEWTGVNEDTPYSPASLLKVPTMIAYLKESQDTPSVLSKRYLYATDRESVETSLVDTPLLVSGREYTVSELIRGMIVQSDNEAKDILVEHANKEILKDTYQVLGIEDPYASNEEYQTSVKTFALFFRVLYNGTYLTRELSNAALALLSDVEFDRGLRAGTPSSIEIANKYGIRAETTATGLAIELSDCGIVYYPDAPYLLCVVAEGTDPDTLAGVIRDVAATAYENVRERD